MVSGGLIRRLNHAVHQGKTTYADVWHFCHSRIRTDIEAVKNGLGISAHGLPSTNSFISQVSSDDPLAYPYQIKGPPLAVKDNFCVDASVFNVNTTCASLALANFRPAYNAAVVQSCLDFGFALAGKTNMDEFAMGCGSVDAPMTGPVVNPWSLKTSDMENRISGGSSGGSVVAVAAGLCVAAIASDTGGSCRLPSALCGVTGLKPTYGLLSRFGLIPLANCLDTSSVVSLQVTDVADLLAACIVDNPTTQDSTCLALGLDEIDSFKKRLRQVGRESDRAKVRVGIPAEYYAPGLTEEIALVWDKVACWCADRLDCEVETVRLPHMPFACAVYAVISSIEVASNMSRYDGIEYGYRATARGDNVDTDTNTPDLDTMEGLFAATRSASLGEVVRSRILAGNYFLLRANRGRHLDAARKMWRLIHDELHAVFQRVDVLLTPTHLETAPKITDFRRLDNQTRVFRDDVCTAPINLAGLPAVSLPIATSAVSGLPIGLQLIGPRLSEPRLLSLAYRIEQLAGFKPLVDIAKLMDL